MSLRDQRIDERTARDPKQLAEALTRIVGDVRDDFTARGFSAIQWHEAGVISVPTAAGPAYVRAERSTGQSIPNGAITTVLFDTEVADTHSAYSPATGLFTAPSAGVYRLSQCAAMTPAAATLLVSVAQGTGGGSYRLGREYRAAAGEIGASGGADFVLAAGQTLGVGLYQNSGAAVNTSAGVDCWVTIAQQTGHEVAPASCWPYDFLADSTERPFAVLLTECAATDGSLAAPSGLQWETLTKSGKPHIRVRNLNGLVPGKSYRLRFLVLWE